MHGFGKDSRLRIAVSAVQAALNCTSRWRDSVLVGRCHCCHTDVYIHSLPSRPLLVPKQLTSKVNLITFELLSFSQ